MKKHWRFLVGVSILAGSLLLKKKQAPIKIPSTEDLQKMYQGKWLFVYPAKGTEHTLEIQPTFALAVNGKKNQGPVN